MTQNRLPDAALSRFPGTGETGLHDHLQNKQNGRGIAFCVNETSAVNIDA